MSGATGQRERKRSSRRWTFVRPLALIAALAVSGSLLWSRREPWFLAYTPPDDDIEDRLSFLAFSADGERVLTFHWKAVTIEDQEKYLWVRDCSSLRPRVRLMGCSAHADSGSFAADGTRALVLNREDEVQVFDTAEGKQLCTYRGHVEGYPVPEDGSYPHRLHARFSPDGRLVASWYEYGPRRGVRIWDATTGRDLWFLKNQGGEADAVAWSQDAKRVATQEFDGPVALWDIETGRRLQSIGPKWGVHGRVAAFCYGSGGLRVLISDGARMYVVDAEAERTLCDLERPPAEFWDARFSPDGTKVATRGRELIEEEWGEFHVAWWDVGSGCRLGEAQQLPEGVGLMTFSSDSRRLLTIDAEFVFRIHDADANLLLARAELPEGDVRAQALVSSDGTCLVYYEGSWFGRDMLWLRRRPEWWWGVFWLPELHLVAALGVALIWSLWRDVQASRSRASTQPSPDA